MGLLSSAVWWSLVVVPLLYVILKTYIAFRSYRKRCLIIAKMPGMPPPNPFFGHVLELPPPNDELLETMRERLIENPRLSYAFLGPTPSVALLHPETAKEILKTSEPKPRNAMAGAYNFVLPWLGEGLLVANGGRWARNRKLLTPAFHFDILKPYTKVNNLAVEVLLEKFEKFANNKEYFDVFNHISLCTFDIILRCAFSYENDCQLKGDSHPYVKAVNELTTSLPYRLVTPYLYPDFLFFLSPTGRQFRKNCKYVHKLAEEIIQARRNTLAKTDVNLNKRYLDFLDILLTAKDADGKGLSDKEIRQECDTFLFEGHDTTASGISWMLYSLAENPEHMRKCQHEIDQLLEGRESDTIEWEDLPKLKHLSLCLKEALRLHTPVPYIQRITTKDCYIDGFLIPKHTNISLPLYAILHNPTVWDKPMEFIPERFTSEQSDKLDSHSFLPFSAGPRNCIGQNFALHEMKVVVARIIRKFDLELKPGHKVGHVMMAVMKAENGMYMQAIPRVH